MGTVPFLSRASLGDLTKAYDHVIVHVLFGFFCSR